MNDVLDELRAACASVADRAEYVHIERDRIAAYVATLPGDRPYGGPDPEVHLTDGTREELAAFWLTLDAINFGSRWFPTLRKRAGRSGYFTIATARRDRFIAHGPWPAPALAALDAAEIATALGQDPKHELMALFAGSLNDLGRHLTADHGGPFAAVVDAAGSSAVAASSACRRGGASPTPPATTASRSRCSSAPRSPPPTSRAGLAAFRDLDRLTMFADNLVPHVLRLDGLLTYDPVLLGRIDSGALIEHGSREEVEIRACALHTVALLAAQRAGALEADIDAVLWHRGQEPRYKVVPRHRSRCTAY